MKIVKCLLPLIGVATLLWNGHVFSIDGSPFVWWSAVLSTCLWALFFVTATYRA